MKTVNPYKEAMLYIDNARVTLISAGKEDRNYKDEKYVHTACGTAYTGVLKALNMLFNFKNVPKKKGRKSIEYYQENLARIDKKLLCYLNNTYNALHISGYYDGNTDTKVIESGMENAILIINALKPDLKNGTKSKLK